MDSGWIPDEIHRNPLESAGIRRNHCRHSPGIPPEFQTTPNGIPPELLPAFPRYSTGNPGWNSAGIIAGIPPVFHQNSGLEFRRNYCRHSPGIPPEFRAGIPPELLPAFPRYSAGIIAGIPPELLPAFPRYSTGIPPELLLSFPRHSTRIMGRNSAGSIAGISPVF